MTSAVAELHVQDRTTQVQSIGTMPTMYLLGMTSSTPADDKYLIHWPIPYAEV